MNKIKDLAWFKSEVEPNLSGYTVSYRFFEEGDFGALHQALFESEKVGGNVDFWGLGWVGLFVWDYEKNEELLNVLTGPEQLVDRDAAFDALRSILKI